MQTTLDLKIAKKTEIQYHQVSILFLKLGKCPIFLTLKKMSMRKIDKIKNF